MIDPFRRELVEECINTTGAQSTWAPAWRVGGIAPERRLFLCRVGRCRVHVNFDVVSFQLGVCTGKRFSCMSIMLTLHGRYFVLTFFLFGFKTIPTIEETNEIPPQEINHAAVVWQAIPSLLHTPSAPGNCITMKANAREITATAKSMSFFCKRECRAYGDERRQYNTRFRCVGTFHGDHIAIGEFKRPTARRCPY